MKTAKVTAQTVSADEYGNHDTLAVVFKLSDIGGRYDSVTDTVVIERAIVPPSEELMMALRVIAKEGTEKLADEVMDKINKIAIIEDIIDNARIEM